jgi:hypothetical protein
MKSTFAYDMVAKTESIPTPIADKSPRDVMAAASSFSATPPQKRDPPTKNFETNKREHAQSRSRGFD